MHYLILGGGISPEKEVSHRSAAAVTRALEALGHTVTYKDPEDTPIEDIIKLGKASDGVFPILHGVGGEDGNLQTIFEKEGIAYFGPRPNACRDTFDKADFKRILEKHNIPTPRWNVISKDELTSEPLAQEPFVLKPIGGGSSIDTFIIRELPYDAPLLQEALARYGTMMIEELIDGSEVTVGVLESTALPVIEIIPPADQDFDYENKYNGATKELCPPVNVSPELQQVSQELALKAHLVTECGSISRTDIMIDKQGNQYVIDTNTIPGLTDQSLYPKAALVAGYNWNELVDKFTQLVK